MTELLGYLDKIRKHDLRYFKTLPLGMTSCEYNVHIQLNKLAEARQSYLVLMDVGQYTDAMLIAGHILENCAIINYLSASLGDNEKKIQKYLARETVQTLTDLLRFAGDDCSDAETNKTIDFIIEDFKSRCASVLKNKSQTHELLINVFMETKHNTDRIKILRDNYEFPIVEDYMRPFRRALATFYQYPDIDSKLVLFYAAYCKIKHCGASIYGSKLCKDVVVIDKKQYMGYSPIIVWMCLDYTEHNIKQILQKCEPNKNVSGNGQ